LTGVLEKKSRDGQVYDWFRYDVVRVWEQPVDLLLASGLTVVPLVRVSDRTEEKLPRVAITIAERLTRETSTEAAATLWNATRILMGLRYKEEPVDSIIDRVSAMLFGIRGVEESSTWSIVGKWQETGKLFRVRSEVSQENRDMTSHVWRGLLGNRRGVAGAKGAGS
jgi:hypothetical protein